MHLDVVDESPGSDMEGHGAVRFNRLKQLDYAVWRKPVRSAFDEKGLRASLGGHLPWARGKIRFLRNFAWPD